MVRLRGGSALPTDPFSRDTPSHRHASRGLCGWITTIAANGRKRRKQLMEIPAVHLYITRALRLKPDKTNGPLFPETVEAVRHSEVGPSFLPNRALDKRKFDVLGSRRRIFEEPARYCNSPNTCGSSCNTIHELSNT